MASLLGVGPDGTLSPIPGVTVDGDTDLVSVDDGSDEPRAVPLAEAGRGMLRYAQTLKPGSPARGEVERQAIAMAEQAGAWPPWVRKQKRGRRA